MVKGTGINPAAAFGLGSMTPKAEPARPVETPAAPTVAESSAPAEPKREPAKPRKPRATKTPAKTPVRKPTAGWKILNVAVAPDVHRAVRMASIMEEIPMGALMEALIRWGIMDGNFHPEDHMDYIDEWVGTKAE